MGNIYRGKKIARKAGCITLPIIGMALLAATLVILLSGCQSDKKLNNPYYIEPLALYTVKDEMIELVGNSYAEGVEAYLEELVNWFNEVDISKPAELDGRPSGNQITVDISGSSVLSDEDKTILEKQLIVSKPDYLIAQIFMSSPYSLDDGTTISETDWNEVRNAIIEAIDEYCRWTALKRT